MGVVTIQVSGISGVESALSDALATITKQVDTAVQTAGINCEGYAKQACPVHFGRLRASIQYAPTGQCQCSCGTNVEYAPYVEHGTYASRDEPFVTSPTGMAPRPFLFPAYVRAKQDMRQELAAIPGVKVVSWS